MSWQERQGGLGSNLPSSHSLVHPHTTTHNFVVHAQSLCHKIRPRRLADTADCSGRGACTHTAPTVHSWEMISPKHAMHNRFGDEVKTEILLMGPACLPRSDQGSDRNRLSILNSRALGTSVLCTVYGLCLTPAIVLSASDCKLIKAISLVN